MTHDFEYISYDEDDRIAILENKAAELEQRLLAAVSPGRKSRWPNVATPDEAYPAMPAYQPDPDPSFASPSYPDEPFAGEPFTEEDPDLGAGPGGGARGGAGPATGAHDRTAALLNHGRQRGRAPRGRRILAHWRLLAVAAAALAAGIGAALLATGGSSASWPASVSTVQAEIKQACANQDVAAEPSGLNFACDGGTQSVLWVFSLLTSGNNPGYVDQGNGRKGLEPIAPAQGGDIAWSLNLHHPYDAADPVDSLQVAARAINNIISGATLTSSAGAAQVEPGLESKAANCQRYTGSAKLVTQAGYPARCAAPVSSGAGQAALVSDVFRQWMGGPSTIAAEAGVLFQNSGNPGDPRVQAILRSLPASGG